MYQVISIRADIVNIGPSHLTWIWMNDNINSTKVSMILILRVDFGCYPLYTIISTFSPTNVYNFLDDAIHILVHLAEG